MLRSEMGPSTGVWPKHGALQRDTIVIICGCATFKVLRRARTRCSLSLSRGSLALCVKQRRNSCLLQGLESPRAVTLACSRARYSCSSPSNGSGSRHSDTRRSLPSDTLLSLLSTLNSIDVDRWESSHDFWTFVERALGLVCLSKMSTMNHFALL